MHKHVYHWLVLSTELFLYASTSTFKLPAPFPANHRWNISRLTVSAFSLVWDKGLVPQTTFSLAFSVKVSIITPWPSFRRIVPTSEDLAPILSEIRHWVSCDHCLFALELLSTGSYDCWLFIHVWEIPKRCGIAFMWSPVAIKGEWPGRKRPTGNNLQQVFKNVCES